GCRRVGAGLVSPLDEPGHRWTTTPPGRARARARVRPALARTLRRAGHGLRRYALAAPARLRRPPLHRLVHRGRRADPLASPPHAWTRRGARGARPLDSVRGDGELAGGPRARVALARIPRASGGALPAGPLVGVLLPRRCAGPPRPDVAGAPAPGHGAPARRRSLAPRPRADRARGLVGGL